MTEEAFAFVRRIGALGGAPVVYLHGAPGSPAEAELIADAARAAGVELWAIDRARVAPGRGGADYVGALADLVRALGDGRQLPLLGFSIGAALALRIAARLGEAAGPLRLVSAAGPLDRPGAFDGMGAGAAVFRAARADGAGFRLAVGGQALLARRAPGALRRLLFAGSDASDRTSASTPGARALLSRVFAEAWANGGSGYRRDLLTYVGPWSGELARVAAPVELWHGRADRWAPIATAHGLAARLPTARLHAGDAGHYATLVGCAPAALAAARDRA